MPSGYHILGGSFEDLETEVKAINRRVTPWLWIFPIAGFLITLWDKYPKMRTHYLAWRQIHE